MVDHPADRISRAVVARLRALPPAPDPSRVTVAAAAAGLLDVAYGSVDTDLGPLLVATTHQGLARIAFLDLEDEDEVLAGLAATVSPRIMRAPAQVAAVTGQLTAYLAGERTGFDLAVDLRTVSPFGRRVLTAVQQVPVGTTTTYGALARTIGAPRAARAVGRALGANPIPIVVPCHRVVPTGGGLGGYRGGTPRKAALLAHERAA